MKDKHIIEVLDNASIVRLSETELSEIQAHVRECVSCRGAYDAARLSGMVLQSRAQAAIKPSPFFQTRVMAAWREQQAVESVPAMWRLWSSAKALVSSMAVTTAALAVLSFVMPGSSPPAVDQTASALSAESVILGSEEQISYEQVLSTIYEDDDEAR
jgi:predicted anti-sigma-YlaC factor YlaD